jgi:hypothetical protein
MDRTRRTIVLDQYAPLEAPQSSSDGGNGGNHAVGKTWLWIGVAGISAALAFTVVRAVIGRRPADETSQRIQHLIDEANTLLKTLDDKKHA